MLEVRPEQAAFEFRLRWDLNTEADQIDLSVLEEDYRPVFEDLTEMGCMGYAIYARPNISRVNPATIYVEQSLSVPEQRAVYVHEIGHIVCNHPPSAMTHALNRWVYAQYERRAGVFAAYVLIPGHLLLLDISREEVASRAGVPVELVDLYWASVVGR